MLWFIILITCSVINLFCANIQYEEGNKGMCLFGGFASGFCFVTALFNLFL